MKKANPNLMRRHPFERSKGSVKDSYETGEADEIIELLAAIYSYW